MYCDSSDYSISYILGQKDNEGREVVIHYGGHALRPAEINYSITHKEGLALVEGIKYYHIYLIGRNFTVFTDHQALKSLPTNKDVSGRLARWAIHLQGYNFDIVDKPGKKHGNAGALSRRTYPLTPELKEDDHKILANLQHQLNTLFLDIAPDYSDNCATLASLTNTSLDNPPYYRVITRHRPCIEYELSFNCDEWEDKKLNAVTVTYYVRTILQDEDEHEECDPIILLNNVTTNTKTSLREDQLQDEETGSMIRYKENQVLPVDDNVARRLILESHDFEVEKGLLYHFYYPRGKGHKTERLIKQLVVPLNLRDDVLRSYHYAITACHQGIERTYQTIRQKYFWHSMYSDIQIYVKSCLECQRSKMDKHARQSPLRPIPPEEAPFDRIHMNFLGPLKETKEGYEYILLIIDSFSKFPEAFPTFTQEATEVAKIYYNGIICQYGAPRSIFTDVSCKNWSKKYVKYSKLLRLTYAVTTPKEMLLLKDSTV